MITKQWSTSFLLLAALGVAAPALAQRAPVPPPPPKAPSVPAVPDPDFSRLTADLSRLGDELAQLSDLASLAGLSALESLPDLRELQDLRIPEIRALARRHADFARQHDRQSRRASGPEQTERVTKTFKVGRNGSLYLVNVSGDVIVKAGSGDEITMDATKHVRQGADAKQQLDAVSVDTSQQGSRVEVRTRYPQRGGNFRSSVDYTFTVPPGTTLDVHSTSGDIRINDVKGPLRADCTSGDVDVEGADQIEQVKTVSGDVTVIRSAGTDVRIGNYSGDLILRGLKARTLDVNTISGDAKLTDVTAERAAVKSMSGGVDYSGPFAHAGRYEFNAHSGDVRITPTGNSAGFEIEARTFSGDVRCDLPLAVSRTEVSPVPARGVRGHGRHEIRGTYGDGSALVTIHTFNGDVIVALAGPVKK